MVYYTVGEVSILKKAVSVLLVMLVFLFSPALAETTDEAAVPQEYKIQLEMEQRLFYLGEEAVVPVTVRYDQSIRGKLELKNDQGHVYAVALLNGSGLAEINIKICETDARIGYLVGVSGQEESEKLLYRVQPRVTEQMVSVISDVCSDLGAGLEAAGLEQSSVDEVMTALGEMLAKDSRVAAFGENNGMMLFRTTDGLLGFYEYSDSPDIEFGDAESLFMSRDKAFDLYQNGQLDAGAMIASNIPITNKKIIYLAPFPEDRVIAWGETVFPSHLERIASKGGFSMERYVGVDAIEKLMNGSYGDCGLLMLQTHGAELLMEDGRTLLTIDLGLPTEEQLKRLSDYLFENTKLLFMTEHHEQRAEAGGDAKYKFYINDAGTYALYGAFNYKGEEHLIVKVTTNYLEKTLKDKRFDNTIIFYNVCHSASDARLRELLLSRGASAFISTTRALKGIISLRVLEEIENMTEQQADGTYIDITKAVANVDVPPSAETLEEYYSSTVAIGATDPNRTSREKSDEQMLELHRTEQLGNAVRLFTRNTETMDRVLFGAGAVEGFVKTKEQEPVAGATVTFYQWLDHDFHRVPDESFSVTTDENGAYRAEGLPYGQYGIKAEKVAAKNFVTLSIDAPEQNAPDIFLAPKQIVVTTEVREKESGSANVTIVQPTVLISDQQEPADRINARLEEMYAKARSIGDEMHGTSCDDPNNKHSYSLMITDVNSCGNMLFLSFQESRYTSGAARGQTQKYALAFDCETGNEASITSVLPEDPLAREALCSLIEEKLEAREKDLFVSAEQAAQGALEGTSATWMLEGSELCVIYPADRIAPHFVGNITVRLPLSELHGILDEKYLPAESDPHGGAQIVLANEITDFGTQGSQMLKVSGDITNVTAAISWGTRENPYRRTVIFYASGLYEQSALLPDHRDGEWYTITYESDGQLQTIESE